MTKDVLNPKNDGCYVATLYASLEPVRNKDKSPVLFPTLSAGKSYLKKRFKDDWTKHCFRMSRYVLDQGTEVAIQG